jgi:hypothetical protein
MHQAAGEYGRALVVIDAIQPGDPRTLAHVELRALGMARLLKDGARGEKAVERLFAVRLPAGDRLKLADELHRLGLPEPADALVREAAPEVGRSLDILVRLIQKALADDQAESAVDAAFEVLRRTWNVHDQERRKLALRVLKDAGKLDDLIRRAEERLQAAAVPAPHIAELRELYTAAGLADKLKALEERVADKGQLDRARQIREATQKLDSGDRDEQKGALISLLKADPRALGRVWPKLGPELADFMLDEFDLQVHEIDRKAHTQRRVGNRGET